MIYLSKKIRVTALIVVVLFVNQLSAQTTSNNTNLWASCVPIFKFSDQINVKNEFHWRRSDFVKNWMQLVIRPSINYTPVKGLTLTVGYTYADTYPYDSEFGRGIVVPENNLWEQVVFKHSIGKVKITHRYRLENRWIGIVNNSNAQDVVIDGRRYVNRFRYRLIGNVPIFKFSENQVSASLFNEVFITLNKNLGLQSLNQNWIVGLLNLHFKNKDRFSIGLQNQRIQQNGGVDLENNFAMWMEFVKIIDLSKKEKITN